MLGKINRPHPADPQPLYDPVAGMVGELRGKFSRQGEVRRFGTAGMIKPKCRCNRGGSRAMRGDRRRSLNIWYVAGRGCRRGNAGVAPATCGELRRVLRCTQQADEIVVGQSGQHLTARLAEGDVTLHLGHLVVIEDSPAERIESSQVGMVQCRLSHREAPLPSLNRAGVVVKPGCPRPTNHLRLAMAILSFRRRSHAVFISGLLDFEVSGRGTGRSSRD